MTLDSGRPSKGAAGGGRRPVRFETVFQVTSHDIDDLGHVNNLVYVRWVQEVAKSHWGTAARPGDQEALAWVVVRHEIDYLHPAVEGDEILARTWVETWKGATSDRRTELLRRSDGTVLARARTLWGALDRKTGKLRRLPAGLSDPFTEEVPEEA